MNLVGISCPVGLEISRGVELWDLQGGIGRTGLIWTLEYPGTSRNRNHRLYTT